MKVARLLGFLLATLILIPMAHADGPVTMVFQNVNGANDGQYYVSPYAGIMNGQTVTLFCDDVLNDVNFGQTWRANVTNLGTAIQNNDFSQTRYGGVPASLVYGSAAQTYYQEGGWLTTQFGSNSSNYQDLQYALWFLMNPNLTKYDTAGAQAWLDMAGTGYTSIDPKDFLIITNTSSPDNPLALTGQVQEFLVVTPEPGTFAMVACAMLALVITLFRRGLLSA
jgi:hypothetical protein